MALVGYTNAGKSTLMNKMLDIWMGDTEKKVLEKDMLFATLDTTVRRISPGDNRDFLLSDTVGFISQLPAYAGQGIPLHAGRSMHGRSAAAGGGFFRSASPGADGGDAGDIKRTAGGTDSLSVCDE